eukprot:463222_1
MAQYEVILLLCISFILNITWSQHGCTSGSCTLTSDSSYINSQIYCTENVDVCSIHCSTGYLNGCHDSSIWLSGTTNTLRCDATQTCEDATVYCGYPYNSLTPSGLLLTDFDDNMVTECNVICSHFLACNRLKLYCNGNVSLCTITAYNGNAFRDGLFECNNNENTYNQCNIGCDTWNSLDCAGSIMNCNDMEYCSCTGDGCSALQINSMQPTQSITVTPTSNPTFIPTFVPTFIPTSEPTINPTIAPTINPTIAPTINPTIAPTINPTIAPTIYIALTTSSSSTSTTNVESGEIKQISSYTS